MEAPEQQPDRNRKLLTDIAPLADSLSKSVAAIAIALYACGFLIVSLHHSKYGFIGTNPFRPRILAAGAWFLFFSAIPITAAATYRDWSWMRIVQNLYFFWGVCLGLSLPLSWLMFTSEAPPVNPHSNWWWITAAGLLIVLILVVAWKEAPANLKAFASVIIVLFFVQLELTRMLRDHSFGQQSVALWFFGVFVVTIIELKWLAKAKLAQGGDWSKPLGTIFLVLLVFAEYYYPHLKTSWGGGTPVSVTIYFTKDSAISPSRAVPAQLVEESDEGFYIVGPKEAKAIFVPRNAVALVYFSDRVADSLLLRDSK